jgi:hypothetical protein
MADPAGDLAGFAYGEDLEGLPPRSLGYRLLAPLTAEPWCAEVEALARRLQAAPYSDHWPATDLFCSVLLADGRRLVALARYGLSDHTPSQRRGGLELVGVVAPPSVDVRSSLAVYSWLQRRRTAAEDLHQLGGSYRLADVLATAAPPAAPADPLPVLPVRLWQEGALLFAASTPSDPDHRLRLLEQGAGASWQWLPLVGPDFPLQTYAQHGPLVAWTPHFAGVALKLDRKSPETAPHRAHPPNRSLFILAACLVVVLAALLIGNLWSLQDLRKRLTVAAPSVPSTGATVPAPETSPQARSRAAEDVAGRERLLKALRDILKEGGGREWQMNRQALLKRYDEVVKVHKDLRVPDDDDQAKLTVAAISILAERSADRIEEMVVKALSGKGFSDHVIKAAREHIHEQFQGKESSQ